MLFTVIKELLLILESRNLMKFKHFFSISLFVSFCVFPCSMTHLVRVYLVVYYLKDLILHYGHNLQFFFNYFIVVRVVNNNKSYCLFRKWTLTCLVWPKGIFQFWHQHPRPATPKIWQSSIKYAGSLGWCDKWLIDQASDVPSIIFFIISYSLMVLKTFYFHYNVCFKKTMTHLLLYT